jgi:hypothetical protein
MSTGSAKIMIKQSASNIYWNYFLALERDLEIVSRYVEFTEDNYPVYSIELAHLLLAAASEIDTVAKLTCAIIAPNAARASRYGKQTGDAGQIGPTSPVRIMEGLF